MFDEIRRPHCDTDGFFFQANSRVIEEERVTALANLVGR